MTLDQAIMAAQTTPSGTPEYEAACAICALRGVDPHSFQPYGRMPAPHWQLVIAEQLVAQTLRDAMIAPVLRYLPNSGDA